MKYLVTVLAFAGALALSATVAQAAPEVTNTYDKAPYHYTCIASPSICGNWNVVSG